MARHSILTQIARSATAMVVLFAVIWTAGAVVWLYSNSVFGLDRHADLEVRELAAALAPLVWNLDDQSIQALVNTKAEDPELVSIDVQESSGGKRWTNGRPTGPETTKRVAPILVDGRAIGTISLGLSLEPRLAEMVNQIAVLIASQFLLLGIVLLSLTFSWRRVVSRLQAMVHSVDRFTRDQHDSRMPVVGDDELSRLALGFNAMAARIQKNTLTMEREIAERTEKLMEAEKLALVGSLVAGVAHEINTPVGNSITITSWLAARAKEIEESLRNGEVTPEDLRSFLADTESSLGIVQSGLGRTSELIQGFKVIGASQVVDERRLLWMSPFLNEVVSSLAPTLKPYPHRVSVDCPVDFVVENHAGALFQIVTNLVLNAHLHAFPPDGAGNIVVQSEVAPDDREAFLLSVRDDGTGMDPGIQEKIFEPFFTTSRTRGGTGLGLSIVASLVNTLGGTIEVHSRLGQGSVFDLRLPLVAPDQPSAH